MKHILIALIFALLLSSLSEASDTESLVSEGQHLTSELESTLACESDMESGAYMSQTRMKLCSKLFREWKDLAARSDEFAARARKHKQDHSAEGQ